MAAAAFREKRVFGVQFHAALKGIGWFAVLAHAHVARGHTLDAAVVVVKHFGCGKSRKNLHAETFRLLAEPAAEVAEADDVITVILKTPRQQKSRHLE